MVLLSVRFQVVKTSVFCHLFILTRAAFIFTNLQCLFSTVCVLHTVIDKVPMNAW